MRLRIDCTSVTTRDLGVVFRASLSLESVPSNMFNLMASGTISRRSSQNDVPRFNPDMQRGRGRQSNNLTVWDVWRERYSIDICQPVVGRLSALSNRGNIMPSYGCDHTQPRPAFEECRFTIW
jgi:hypothetical protein